MAILAVILRWLAPGFLVLGLFAIAGLGAHVVVLTRTNDALRADLAAAEASLALSRANADRLQGALDRQSAAVAALHDQGEARRSATESRLKAFPDAALPAEWGAPLTGATACERAEEVMDRFIEGLK